MDKKALQNKVNELKLTLGSLELNAKATQKDLMEATKELEDVSKVKITRDIVNDIRNVIEESIRNSSLSNVCSYDVDFEIDYNNSLALGSIEFQDEDQLSEEISDGIENLFNIIDDEDEN